MTENEKDKSSSSHLPDTSLMMLALREKCPRCGEGRIFTKKYISTDVVETCPQCGLDLSDDDSADGPAVFLIFILGFLLVPAALGLEYWLSPPMWVHILVFGLIAFGIVAFALRPLKAYVIALQYKYLRHKTDDTG